MPSRIEIVSQMVEAMRTRDTEKVKALTDHFADGIVLASPMGNMEGKEAVLGRLARAPGGGGGGMAAGMMEKVEWGEPEASGDDVKVGADLPPGLPLPFPIKGIDMTFSFDGDDKIARINFSPRM